MCWAPHGSKNNNYNNKRVFVITIGTNRIRAMEFPSAIVPPPPDADALFDDIFFSPTFSNRHTAGPSKELSEEEDYFDTSFTTLEFERKDNLSETFIPQIGDIPDNENYYNSSPLLFQEESVQFADQTSTSRLRSIKEIPEEYRSVFSGYSSFNTVQSQAFNHVLYSDKHMVISAPTGSGKTVVFELAIIRLMSQSKHSFKIVYVAPIKALCSERYTDWNDKFGPLSLTCCELTGDTEMDDYFELQRANIITTTPEKWDSMTRRWRDNQSLVQQVRLFFIDEVHQLNDGSRGPTVEAIVSRMKTVRTSLQQREGATGQKQITAIPLRFIAVSATIPNICDIACWLGTEQDPAISISIDDSNRPVKLHKVVLGYPESTSSFKFDMTLNYRLAGVIQSYSDNKPTLVFCSTRKATQQAATTLTKDARFVMGPQHRQRLQLGANSIRENKLRELIMCGVGYHHAGLDSADRKILETMFLSGELPVLFCTSTLAMGVNFPAHLVIIKSTQQYVGGVFSEYSETQVLQMIGRAGRPQFDTTATVVIMTRNATKEKYEVLLTGAQVIESSLHKNLIEHLNAEIVLHTITSVPIALEWIKSTFLYIRIKQNPSHYGKDIPETLSKQQLEDKLQELVLQNLTLLSSDMLITMTEEDQLAPTDIGSMMARYCVAYQSMRRFLQLAGDMTLGDLVSQLSCCEEFRDIYLRVNEKKTLNGLNKNKTRQTIQYPMEGKIKTTDMKINCLIQTSLGCLPLHDFALNQDTQKIFRSAARLSRCMMELQWKNGKYLTSLNTILFYKSIQCRLWENSKHVAKQLDKIGPMLSNALVNAGMISFEKIASTNPRELELIVNRHPPFGNQLRDAAAAVPRYAMSIQQCSGSSSHRAELQVTISCSTNGTIPGNSPRRGCVLLVGDSNNNVVYKYRASYEAFCEGHLIRKMEAFRAIRSSAELKFHWISLDFVGVDVKHAFTPSYDYDFSSDNKENSTDPIVLPATPFTNNRRSQPSTSYQSSSTVTPKKTTIVKNSAPKTQRKRKLLRDSQMENYLSELHSKTDATPSATPAKRIKATDSNTPSSLADRFSYLPPLKAKLPQPKQTALTPTAKASSTVSATPTPSISAKKSLFPPNNCLPGVSTSKPCSSTPTKPHLASLPAEPNYYHEVDSDFLDFDTWSPDVPVSMLSPISPPDHDMTQTRTSIPPQPSFCNKEPSSTMKSSVVSILPIKTSSSNYKQFINTTKRASAKVTQAPQVPKNDPCSFFTAGSTNSPDDEEDNFSIIFNGIF